MYSAENFLGVDAASPEPAGPVRRGRGPHLGLLIVATLLFGLAVLVSLRALGDSHRRLRGGIVEATQFARTIDVARSAQVHFKREVQEWKDVLLRGYEPGLYDKYWSQFLVQEAAVANDLRVLEKFDPADAAESRTIVAELDDQGRRYRAAIARFDVADRDSYLVVDRAVRGQDRPLTDAMGLLVEHVDARLGARLGSLLATAQDRESQARWQVLLSFGLALLAAGVLAGALLVGHRQHARAALRQARHKHRTLASDLALKAQETSAVRTLNAFLTSIVDNIPSMIFVKRADDLSFVRLNEAAERAFGIASAAAHGKSDADFFPAEQADFFRAKDLQALAGRTPVDVPEEPLDTPEGRRWLHTRKIPILDGAGAPEYLLGIAEDITDRKRSDEERTRMHGELERRVEERTRELSSANEALHQQIDDRERAEAALRTTEEQLQQSQKMEALGLLAGGVAHDFNNLLSIIVGGSQLMMDELHEGDPLREELGAIEEAGLRAAGLTRQLLAFSRKEVVQPRVLDANSSVTALEKMLRRVLGEDIELRLSLAANTMIFADPGQLEQILLNLIVNARDAMPRGGLLTIESSEVAIDAELTHAHVGWSPGRHVVIAVSDTGVGMDAAVQRRIFEPFFTTKPKGQGTGLGLSTVFGIVQQIGGHVLVASEPGRGTTFKLFFPAAEADATIVAVPAKAVSARGHETILLVEDEAQVRHLASRVLQRGGYQVLAAANAGEALLIAERHEGVIHLLLTDVVMPHVDGRELASRMVALRPGLSVLFMSGYTENAILRRGVLDASAAFISKPLLPAELARRVRQLLDERTTHVPATASAVS